MTNYLIINHDKNVIDKTIQVLKDFPDFNCVGYSHNYEGSVDIVLREMPDLVLIDIDTKSHNAFDLVKELKQYLKSETEFIAYSASKEKAYDAIKMGFFDYFLKPVSDLDIRKAVVKFKKKHPFKANKTICLKSYKDYQYLNVDEILFLRADNNTTDFHMNDGGIINAFKTLKTFESILPGNFLRIHKSYIINTNYVARVNYGNLKCTIKKHKLNVPFTKTYRQNIELMINALSSNTFPVALN